MPVPVGDEYLILNGFPTSTPAFAVNGVRKLWAGPATRGRNRVIPGASGVRAYRKRATEKEYTLTTVVRGHRDVDGVAHDDPEAGLYLNLAYFRENIADPGATATITAELLLPAPLDLTLTGAVQIVEFEPEPVSPVSMVGPITILIPAGALVETGS